MPRWLIAWLALSLLALAGYGIYIGEQVLDSPNESTGIRDVQPKRK